VVARPAPGVELEDVGEEVLAYDGATLTLLSGAEVAVVRAADGVSDVLDVRVARDLEDRGILTLTEPPTGERFRRPGHVGFCEDGDHVVLMDLRSGLQHVLSESAAEVWWLVLETGTLEDAVATLEESFPGEASVRDEAEAFVRDLVAKGLLEPVT
jgi:hypothetical protein